MGRKDLTMAEEMTNNNNTNETNVETNEQQTVSEKTYSAEEVAQMVAEGKKSAEEKAVAKARLDFEREQREAQRLAKMNEQDREKHLLQQRIEELEAQQRSFIISENKNALAKAMSDRGLPIGFVDYLASDDADAMMSNLAVFEKEFKKAVSKEVDARVKSSTPKSDGGDSSLRTDGNMRKEEFLKLPLSQQQALYQKDPDAYKAIMGL